MKPALASGTAAAGCSSPASACSPSAQPPPRSPPAIGWLVTARAVQGVGAAVMIPLTLTLLSAAVPPQRRGLALGAWGAVGGLAIAFGPFVGGAVVEGASWQWIFWLNVPIGVALLPIARIRLAESYGPATRLDVPGLLLASTGLFGIVLGLVRGNDHGWTSATVLPPLVAGGLLVAAFVAWELRAAEPMLPLRLFRSRGFTVTNVASMLMFFGLFGSIFLLAQFLQTVQHYSPLQAGLRTLPWTAMPIFIAPIAGSLSDRIGGRPLLVAGLAMQAIGLGWLAAVISPTVAYATLIPAFVVSGIGMSLFFAPVANVVLGSVRREQEGIGSGANNAIRELGGVFGIAVLGAVFSARGGYTSGQAFVSGLSAAVWVGAAAVAVAAGAALLLPRLRKTASGVVTAEPVPEPAPEPAPEPLSEPVPEPVPELEPACLDRNHPACTLRARRRTWTLAPAGVQRLPRSREDPDGHLTQRRFLPLKDRWRFLPLPWKDRCKDRQPLSSYILSTGHRRR